MLRRESRKFVEELDGSLVGIRRHNRHGRIFGQRAQCTSGRHAEADLTTARYRSHDFSAF